MLVIPAIDLKDSRCVRLAQGRKSDLKVYAADPVEVAQGFEAAGAQMLHVVDLDGAFDGGASPNRRIASEIISAVSIPVEFGGGIRSAEEVLQLIEIGVERVIIGTLAAEAPDVVKELVEEFGSRVCIGIDACAGKVQVQGWERPARIAAVDLARRVANIGVERIVYTDIARDGMLNGPNVEQTREVARVSGLRVTASGGVSSLEDIKQLMQANEPLIDSVIIGKALYEGRFSLAEALRIAE